MKLIFIILICLFPIPVDAKDFDIYNCVISGNLKGMIIYKYESGPYLMFTDEIIVAADEQDLKSISCKEVIKNFSVRRLEELKEILETDILLLDLAIKNSQI